jgi:bifunctional DNA-binding transcriptional regulator/antitoxin component of YhaV-PrlF toxin-antitoxin module
VPRRSSVAAARAFSNLSEVDPNAGSYERLPRYSLLVVRKVKNEPKPSDEPGSMKPRTSRRHTRISAKHQVTIPAAAFEGAGLAVGDRLEAKPLGVGKVLLERVESSVARFAGALTGAWEADELERSRDEWV